MSKLDDILAPALAEGYDLSYDIKDLMLEIIGEDIPSKDLELGNVSHNSLKSELRKKVEAL